MKKLGFVLILGTVLSAIFMILSTTSCFAANVVESRDVKIVIDGKLGTYSDVPIVTGGRTLLPLRQVLVNLGVKNDDQHIIWNSKTRSIIVKTDSTEINLVVGKLQGKVNDSVINLDAAPMIYKNKTYIPARFVAQSLGKKVIWDAKLKAVLIRDEDEYNLVKKVVDDVNEKMNSYKRCRYTIKSDVLMNGASVSTSVYAQSDNGVIFLTQDYRSGNTSVVQDVYISGQYTYTRIPKADKWLKVKLSDQQLKEYQVSQLGDEEIYSCLFITDDPVSGTKVIKGNIDIPGYSTMSDALGKLTSNQYYIELHVENGNAAKMIMEMSGQYSMSGNKKPFPCSVKSTTIFEDFDGAFEVKLPEGIEKNIFEDE